MSERQLLETLSDTVATLQREVAKLRHQEGPAFEWETWTPVLTQSGAVTKTITSARLLRAGKLRLARVALDITGTGTANNVITVSGLPSASQISSSRLGAVGAFRLLDAGTANYVGTVFANGVDSLIFFVHNTTDAVGKAPNFGLANTDSLSFEAAWETD